MAGAGDPLGGWSPPPSFDGYRVERLLGSGGMGAVYLGVDTLLDRAVALKFVRTAGDAIARQRFFNEARALARLQHPNVVAVYRCGEIQQRSYLAYEFVAGHSLGELSLPLPWFQALRIGIDVARGLAAAHSAGVLHRDVKPANVVRTDDGHVKLIDFGLAMLVGASDVSAAPDSLDGGGMLAGTPAYLAPELWDGASATPGSDVYGLGLLLGELLTGVPPRVAHDASMKPWEDDHLAGHAPPMLVAAIQQCIQRDQEHRFHSAADARDLLEVIHDTYAPLAADEDDEVPTLVRDSYARAGGGHESFAARFYERLFAAYPEVRALFPPDLHPQHVKLATTLQLIVQHLRDPDRGTPILESLGKRHIGYHVVPEHFDAAAEALFAVLAERDAQWSPTVERAWQDAWQRITRVMLRAFDPSHQPGPSTVRALPRSRRRSNPPGPRICYATNGDINLAYQVFGHGASDILVVPGWLSNLEVGWRNPRWQQLWQRLGADHRILLLDPRGAGLSDRNPGSLAVDDRVCDALAVLDDAGCESALVVGLADGYATAVMLAAEHPERVRGLVLYAAGAASGGFASVAERTQIRARWGQSLFVEDYAPSAAADPPFYAWWGEYVRSVASPGHVVAQVRAAAEIDVSPVLAAVSTPTLVVHRAGDRVVPASAGEAVAAAIATASLAIVPGDDHVLFAGDPGPVGDAMRAFFETLPRTPASPRRLQAAIAVSSSLPGSVAARGFLHDVACREIERGDGVIHSDLGDALVTGTFHGPLPAARCGLAIIDAARRAGLLAAVSVDVGAEPAVSAIDACLALSASARPGQVVVSAAVRGLLGGSELAIVVEGARLVAESAGGASAT